MATDEKREHVQPDVAFAGMTFAPLPAGTKAAAVFALVKLDAEAGGGEDEWCVRTTGEFNRLEFLSALSAYVQSQIQLEAQGWLPDEDDE